MILRMHRKLIFIYVIGEFLVRNIQAECDFSKIFRTPKDMRKVNFDHLEIIERAEFDRFESTTPPSIVSTTSTESSAKKHNIRTDGNVANAQVMLRFGGDNIDGTNHVIKVPPQCRHLADVSHTLPAEEVYNHNYFYPPSANKLTPPCHHQYYHPYPPPIPFAFPNYYYSIYEQNQPYLPQELSEFFNRRTAQHFYRNHYRDGNLFDYNSIRKMRKNLPCKYDRADKNKKKPVHLKTRPTNNIVDNSDELELMQIVRPRISRSLKLDDEEVVTENLETIERSTPENTTNQKKEEILDENSLKGMKSFLNNALVDYRCDNCSDDHKMLISYPIFGDKASNSSRRKVLSSEECFRCTKVDTKGKSLENSEDSKDCGCLKYHEKKSASGLKFIKDLEDLLSISSNDSFGLDSLGKMPFFQKYLSSILSVLKLDSDSSDCKSNNSKLEIPLAANERKGNEGHEYLNDHMSLEKGFSHLMKTLHTKPQMISSIPKIIYERASSTNPLMWKPLYGASLQLEQERLAMPRFLKVIPLDSRNYESPYMYIREPNRVVVPEYVRVPREDIEIVYPVYHKNILVQNLYDRESGLRPFCTKCGSKYAAGNCQNCGCSINRYS